MGRQPLYPNGFPSGAQAFIRMGAAAVGGARAAGYHGRPPTCRDLAMALAAPPDLSDPAIPVQPLARTYPRGLFIEPHEHDWGQLLYAMSGVMWVETPHEALVVPPQRAVWLPPGVSHGIRVVSDLQMRNIYLRPSLAATLDPSVQVLQVDNLLRELIVRLVELDPPQPEYYEALVGLALLELRRAHRSQLKIALPDASDRRQVQLATAAAELIQGVPVSRIAWELGYSPSSFSDMFRRELGVAPSQYACASQV